MTFLLRSEGDTTNPQSPRPFGDQLTEGMPVYSRLDGNQLFFIVRLGSGEELRAGETSDGGFHGEGFFDSIVWFKFRGYMLDPFEPVSGKGDYIFHKGYETDPTLGYADPDQGRPHWFPELDTTFSGQPYCEVRLPVNLSPTDGTLDGTDVEIRVRTSCLWDYDVDGSRVGSTPTFTSNPARVIAFNARKAGIDVATRFDWPSWCAAFRDKCDFGIGWAEGAGDGLTGEYFSNDSFSGPPDSTVIDRVIEFSYGYSPPLSRRWTGFIKPPNTGVYTFYLTADDGCRLTVNGVLIIDEMFGNLNRTRVANATLTGGQKYDIEVEYANLFWAPTGGNSIGNVKLEWESSKITRQTIPQQFFYSSSTVAVAGRTIPRFEADVVFQGMPWPQVWNEIMSHCPAVKWEFSNGKIKFKWAADRVPMMTFVYETGIPFTADPGTDKILCTNHGLSNGDMVGLKNLDGVLPDGLLPRTKYWVINKSTNDFQLSRSSGGTAVAINDAGLGTSTYTMRSNIVQASMSAQRTDPLNKPNFMVIGFRNKDDEVFVQSWSECNRDDLRDRALGKIVDPGIMQFGVARQSQVDRIGAAIIIKTSDRDIEVNLKGQKNSHKLAMHDLCWLVHPQGDWRLTPFTNHPRGPILMEVVQEVFESSVSTANEKSYILRVWYPEYDDSAHGPVVKRPPGFIPSPFTPPPIVAGVTLLERIWSLPDSTYALAIDGSVQFDANYPFEQRGRVWWRKPDDERTFTAVAFTDIITSPLHGYENGTPVAVRSDDTLPGGLDPTETYFVVSKTTNTFKLATSVDGLIVDIASGGSGNHFVAPFVLTNQFMTPTSSDLQAAFTLQGVSPGSHQIKVVSESTLQQKLDFELHPTFTIAVALPLATNIKIFDTIAPKDTGMGLGLTIGVHRAVGGGLWFGTRLNRDRGYGYERVADLTREATIGHTTDNGDTWLPASAGYFYFVDETGEANFTAATTDEIAAGKMNFFVGLEKIGVQTPTDLGGGIWQMDDLVRGMSGTDYRQSFHLAQEDVILLDENIIFLPMEARDIDQVISFKPMSYGNTLDGTGAVSFTFYGWSIVPHSPLFFQGEYDAVDGDLGTDWRSFTPQIDQRFLIEVTDSVIPFSQVIDPKAMLNVGDPVSWIIPSDPDGRITLLPAQGADAIYDGSHGTVAIMDPNGTATPNGGLLFEAEIPPDPLVMAFEIVLYPEDQLYSDADYAFRWFCLQARDPITGVLAGPFYMWPEDFGVGYPADDLKRLTWPGDRIYIYLRPDGVGEYGFNYSPLARPLYVSDRTVKPGVNYKVSVVFGTFDFGNYHDSAIRKPRWVRSNPSFRLSAGVQRRIYGLSDSDPLPASIDIRVRELQSQSYGHDSDPTAATFTR